MKYIKIRILKFCSEDVNLHSDHSLLHVYFIDLVGTRYMCNTLYTWHQQMGECTIYPGCKFTVSVPEALNIDSYRLQTSSINFYGTPICKSPRLTI